MAKSTKTNAMRLLDKAGVAYSALTYHVDENDLAATHVAEQLGEDINQVFKTLVLRGERTGLFVCVIPDRKRPQESRPRSRRQKSRNDCHERASWCHRLYPRRMFAYRHEETAAHFFRFVGFAARFHICQRWRSWHAAQNASAGAHRLHRRHNNIIGQRQRR